MKDGREHAALRRAARIVKHEVDLQDVLLAIQNLPGGVDVEAADRILHLIAFGRDSGGARQLDERPVRKARAQLIVVLLEAADSRRECGWVRTCHSSTPVSFHLRIRLRWY